MAATKSKIKSKSKKTKANISSFKGLRNSPRFRVIVLTLIIAALGVAGYFALFGRAASTNNYLYVADWRNDQIKVVNADTQDLVTKIDTSEASLGLGPVRIVKNPRANSGYANKAIVLYGTKGMGGCCGVSSGTPQELGILDTRTNSITKKIDINKYSGVTEKTMQLMGVEINPTRDEAYISTAYKSSTDVILGRVLIFNLGTDTITGKIEMSDQSYGGPISVNSVGSKLYMTAPSSSAGNGKYIYQYDLASKTLTKKIDLGTFTTSSIATVNITNVSTIKMNQIIITSSNGKNIKVLDMNSDTFTKTITLLEQFSSIGIITNASGNKIYFKDAGSQKMYSMDGDAITSVNPNTDVSVNLYKSSLPVNGVNPSPVAMSDDGTKTYVTDISADGKTSYLTSQNSTSYVSWIYVPTAGVTNDWPVISAGTYSDKLTDTSVPYPYSATYFQITDSTVSPPTINSPVANATLTGSTVSLLFTAGDPFGLDKFEVFVDGKLNDSLTNPVYGGTSQYNWGLNIKQNKDGSTITSGNHTVTVRVTDSNANVATSPGVTYNFNNGTTQIDTTPPVVPSGLRSSTIGTSSIGLAWNKNAETDLAGYQIHYREASSQTWNSNAPVVAKSAGETYLLTNLKPDTSYIIQIRAYDGNNNYSAFSSDLSVKTTSSSTTISAPTGLRTTPNNFSSQPWIFLTYNSVSGATSYNLYRDNSKIQSNIKNATMVDMTAAPLVSHTYKMTSIGSNGVESAPSNAISAKCSWLIWWFCQ